MEEEETTGVQGKVSGNRNQKMRKWKRARRDRDSKEEEKVCQRRREDEGKKEGLLKEKDG